MFYINLGIFLSNFQAAQESQMLKTSVFAAIMGILCSELEICLPLAFPSTIYKHFTSLTP